MEACRAQSQQLPSAGHTGMAWLFASSFGALWDWLSPNEKRQVREGAGLTELTSPSSQTSHLSGIKDPNYRLSNVSLAASQPILSPAFQGGRSRSKTLEGCRGCVGGASPWKRLPPLWGFLACGQITPPQVHKALGPLLELTAIDSWLQPALGRGHQSIKNSLSPSLIYHLSMIASADSHSFWGSWAFPQGGMQEPVPGTSAKCK